MFNGGDGDDPPPPYERNPPCDPPPPPPPGYPRLTAPTYRLGAVPIFPVTPMDDPDLVNLNAYRQVEWTEFVKPPGRRMDHTHYAVLVGSHLGITANLITARATQICVSGGWIEECSTFWHALWCYRQKAKACKTRLLFRGNSIKNVEAFEQLAARCLKPPPAVAIYSIEPEPTLSPLLSETTSSEISRETGSLSSASGSTRTTLQSTLLPRKAEPSHPQPPTILVPTVELNERAYASAPPLVRAAMRADTGYSKALKRANSSRSRTSRPSKNPHLTEVIDLTQWNFDAKNHQPSSSTPQNSFASLSATRLLRPRQRPRPQRAISISDDERILRPQRRARPPTNVEQREISISDDEGPNATESAGSRDKGKGKAV